MTDNIGLKNHRRDKIDRALANLRYLSKLLSEVGLKKASDTIETNVEEIRQQNQLLYTNAPKNILDDFD